MKWVFGLLVLTGMAGCGADGEPVQPTRAASILITENGISGGARLGLNQGPISVSLGLGV
ncbi:MAG: hypothetical protein ABJL67_03665 [Sulfitobacter sp.]